MLVDHALAAGGAPAAPAGGAAAPSSCWRPRSARLIGRYRRAGFAGYLIKPLRRASLAERVLIAAGAERRRPSPSRGRARSPPPPRRGKRVLLVEDNPINALLARALLTREGCEVDHAAGGEEALAAVKVGRLRPDPDGHAHAGPVRRARPPARCAPWASTTPIVALTANAFEDDRHACLAAGMNDFLVKPHVAGRPARHADPLDRPARLGARARPRAEAAERAAQGLSARRDRAGGASPSRRHDRNRRAAPRRKRTAMEVLRELRQPKVAVMLALGFSSGLPFLLTPEHPRLLAARRGHEPEGHRLHLLGRARLRAQALLVADRRPGRRAAARPARPPARLDAAGPARGRGGPGRHGARRARRPA